MKTLHRIFVIALTALLLITALSLTTHFASPTAHANLSGEQIDVQSYANSIFLQGYSIVLDQTVQKCFRLPNYDNPLTGWWWVGHVDFATYYTTDCSGSIRSQGGFDIPFDLYSEWYDLVV